MLLNKDAEILERKVSLIYDFNKKSSLFIRAANSELEKNSIKKAIEILTAGIKSYPNYPIPYLLLGKAYAAAGDFSLALKNIKTASELLNSKETYDYYFKEIENIQKKKSLFGFKSSDEKEKIKTEPSRPEYYPLSNKENLEKLAKELTSSKPSDKQKDLTKKYEEEEPSEDSIIVSDTLAKIYEAQGENEEAIKVYKKLISKFPHKEVFYSQKIAELKLNLPDR